MFQVTMAPHDTKIWINPWNVLSVRPVTPEGCTITFVGGSTISCSESDRFVAEAIAAVIAPSAPRHFDAGHSVYKVYEEGDD
jgi:hypothetical protein